MTQTKEIPFATVLAALNNTTKPFPSRYISHLSDLEPANLAGFLQSWEPMPASRKREVLKKMNELFEDDTLLSFEEIASKILKDDDAEVRVMALKLLEETTNPRLIADLVKILQNDPDSHVRARACTVLAQFVRMGELGELPEDRRELVETSMLMAARSEDGHVARSALEALGYSSNSTVNELIAAAFERPDPLWQAAALFAAGRSAENRWQEQILSGLLSPDANVRLAAVQSAGDLELKSARKPLLDMLEDETDEDVFQALVWSLSQIGGEDVRTYLEALLDDLEDDEQVEYVEDALANLSFTEDLEKFDLIAFDPEEEVDEDDD